MAKITTLPERCCGLLSCGELCCSYVGHRGYSHSLCVDASSCTCQNVYDHLVDDLCLSISLGMESYGFSGLVSSIDQRLDQNVLRDLLSDLR